MSGILDDVIPQERIYKDRSIWVGTFLGGPLVAGYFLSENFKSLGQTEKVKFTWIITIIATIVIFGGAFMIAENNRIPNQIIPIIYTAITFGFYKKFQERRATEHIDSGGLVYSWWRVVGVAIIGVLITSVVVFAFIFVFQPDEQSIYKTNTYGSLVKHEISFDETNISEKEINSIAEALKDAVFFDLSLPKYVHAEKDGEVYIVFISAIEGIENNEMGIQYFMDLRDFMNEKLPNNNVEIRLVVDSIENVVKVLK